MDKTKKEDSGKKETDATQQQEKPKDAQQQAANQENQRPPSPPPPYSGPPQGYPGENPMPPSPQSQGQPGPYSYPPPQYHEQPGQYNFPPPQYQGQPSPHSNQPPTPYSQVPKSPEKTKGPYRKKQEMQADEPTPGFEAFEDKQVRRIFVRKVYLILMVQLLFTLGVICLFIFEPNVKHFVRTHYYIQFMALAVFVAVYLGLACSGSMRRKYPTNIILLSIFTVAAAIMMGAMSSYHNTNTVLIAIAICAVVCFAVTLFSFHTKFDFTSFGGILCILLLILVLFGIIAIFVQEKVMTMIYAGLGSIVFMMYLAYDTQMLMGGKNVEISPEEHILAAIQLYIDVIYIFMFLLMLVGGGAHD